MANSKDPLGARVGSAVTKVASCSFQLLFTSLILVFGVGTCVKDGKRLLSCTGISHPSKENTVALRPLNTTGELDRRLGTALVKVAKAASMDINKLRVSVAKVNQINAMTIGTDTFVLCEGLSQLTDRELTAVMAHEVAHAIKNHSARSQRIAGTVAQITSITGSLLGHDEETNDEVASWAVSVVFAPFSREQELEADSFGVEILKNAGYPQDAVEVMCDTLAAIQREEPDSSGGGFLATHPAIPDRIIALKADSTDVIGPLTKQQYWATIERLASDSEASATPVTPLPEQIAKLGNQKGLEAYAANCLQALKPLKTLYAETAKLIPPPEYKSLHKEWLAFEQEFFQLTTKECEAATAQDLKKALGVEETKGALVAKYSDVISRMASESKKYR